MKGESLSLAFDKLATALIADTAMRLKIPFSISPPGLGAVTPNQRGAGPVLPVGHFAGGGVRRRRLGADAHYASGWNLHDIWKREQPIRVTRFAKISKR